MNDIDDKFREEVFALRRYLNGNPLSIEASRRSLFDAFISQIDCFFEMRHQAEIRFRKLRHLAKDKKGSLPLELSHASEILLGLGDVPPMRLARKISVECFSALQAIANEPKKVLRRNREEVRLDKVEDLDSACMINLSRRSGRTLAERAGAKQKILAVNRCENFDLLENRAVKTFARLARILTSRYYTEFKDRRWASEEAGKILREVKRFELLCEKIGMLPEFERVRELEGTLPEPNYVLSQNLNYSKIYKFLTEIVRQYQQIENLWTCRDEVDSIFEKIKERGSELSAILQKGKRPRYYSEIWLNPQSVRSTFPVENPNYDLYPNAESKESYSLQEEERFRIYSGTLILDIKNLPWATLVHSLAHENAKPYLHDDNLLRREEEIKKVCNVPVQKYVNSRVSDLGILREYFGQLQAKLNSQGVSVVRWLLIVPDDWTAEALEDLITVCPLPRENVELIWVSVAGMLFELSSHKKFNLGDRRIVCKKPIEITLNDSGTLVPWRRKLKSTIISILDVSREGLLAGAIRMLELRNQGETPYYDFLDSMYLVVQTPREEIELKEIVERQEKFPGGKTYTKKDIDSGHTSENDTFFQFNLLWTDEKDDDARREAPLRELKTEKFKEKIACEADILIDASIVPGQGLARLEARCNGMTYPLDYGKMICTEKTCNTLEREMNRSFPPVSPHVLSDPSLWCEGWLRLDLPSPWKTTQGNDIFAQAIHLFPDNAGGVPDYLSPLERLRRVNVFGNASSVPREISRIYGSLRAHLPVEEVSREFKNLFEQLATRYSKSLQKYKNPRHQETLNLVRLIAWTYESKNPAFKQIKDDSRWLIREFAFGETPAAPARQYYTVCANLCSTKSEIRDCLTSVFQCLVNLKSLNVKEDEIRLLYNILMFHPRALEWTGWSKDDVMELWEVLVVKATTMRNRNEALKALLYLLRYRIVDKSFLAVGSFEHEKAKSALIGQTKSWRGNPHLVNILHYLDGTGRIDGIPQN